MKTLGTLRRVITVCASLILWAFMGQSGWAAGAEREGKAAEDSPAAGAPATAESQTKAAKVPTPAANRDASSPEVFVPTEEISEDFTVSFPVDI